MGYAVLRRGGELFHAFSGVFHVNQSIWPKLCQSKVVELLVMITKLYMSRDADIRPPAWWEASFRVVKKYKTFFSDIEKGKTASLTGL